jgi:hypothetical protein
MPFVLLRGLQGFSSSHTGCHSAAMAMARGKDLQLFKQVRARAAHGVGVSAVILSRA